MNRALAYLAYARKAVIDGAGLVLVIGAEVTPFVHGTALHWTQLGIAVATAVVHFFVPNAPHPDEQNQRLYAPDGGNRPMANPNGGTE